MKLFWLSICMLLAMTVSAQTVQQADSLHQRGRILLSEGKIAEGRELTRQAMEMRRTLLGEVSAPYITSLNNYAMSFFIEKDYTKARELQEQAMRLLERLQPPHPDRGTYMANMGRFYYFTDDKQQAAKLWEQALPLVEKHGEAYEFVLKCLGMVYDDLNDTPNLDRIMALMMEHDAEELKKPCDEPKCMLERAQYYDVTGNQDMAKECYLKVLAMNMDDEMKMQVYETYARFASHSLHDYVTGAEYYRSSAQLRKAKDGENDAWAQLVFNAARYAFIGKDYTQAAADYQAVADFYARHDSEKARTNWALCQKGLGNTYHAMKQYATARDCFRQLVAYYEQNDTASAEYPRAILRMAKAEKLNKEYAVSIEHHKQAMAMFDRRGLTDDYSDASSSLQFCYAYAGIRDTIDHRFDRSHALRMQRIDTLIQREKQSIELSRKYLSKMTYANSLGVIAGGYGMQERYDSCISYYHPYMEVLRDAVRDEFRTQSERERMLAWNSLKDHVTALTDLLIEMPKDNVLLTEQLHALCYDAELLLKGILLNSAIEFSRVLQAMGDAQLIAAFQQVKQNDAEIERLRQQARNDDDLQRILQLVQDNQALQLQLTRGCAEYADYTNYISYTWRDVQKALRPTDVAIEFVVAGNGVFRTDNRLVALVLTSDMSAPVAVTICDDETIYQMESNEHLFDTPDAANTLWGPLMSYIAGKRRLFFSADGSLNRIGIEYLPVGGKPLSEQYEVYRLSSTKVLCYQHPGEKPQSAALFGAIDYGHSEALSEAERASLMAMRGSKKGFTALKNTLYEVAAIDSLLRGSRVPNVSLLTGAKASKEAFATLSDSRVALIHIATHGDYKEERQSSDAESMERSLLAFGGANRGAQGLVTAADIARMNLRQCDLAVLSACETGLGRLGDDGVFGLQRGFKNAGVHTLMMSLKKVYDDSTAQMMVAFYRYLLGGSTKREALVRAQQDLRRQGFTDAKYWATFILLDAI